MSEKTSKDRKSSRKAEKEAEKDDRSPDEGLNCLNGTEGEARDALSRPQNPKNGSNLSSVDEARDPFQIVDLSGKKMPKIPKKKRTSTGHTSPLHGIYSSPEIGQQHGLGSFTSQPTGGPMHGVMPFMSPMGMPMPGPMGHYQYPFPMYGPGFGFNNQEEDSGSDVGDSDSEASAEEESGHGELEQLSPFDIGFNTSNNVNENDDPLLAIRQRYADEDGAPADEGLAQIVNKIWKRGKDAQVAKSLYEKYPRPSNITPQKVDINEEVMTSLPKFARARDMRLRAVQAGIARAVVPSLRAAEALYANRKLEELTAKEKQVTGMCLDAISMLAHSNDILNVARRELLKPNLNKKFQPLCKVTTENTSELLLGDNLSDRIKMANNTVKIGKIKQFHKKIRQHPYQMGHPGYAYGQYGHGQHYSFGNQYPGYGYGRAKSATHTRQPFLGKPCTYYQPVLHNTEIDVDSMMNETNTESKFYDCRQRPGQEAHQPTEVDSGQEDLAQDETDNPVGELKITNKWAEARAKLTSDRHKFSQIKNRKSLHFIDKWPLFQAGRVNQCYKVWTELTKDRHILANLKMGYKLELEDVPSQGFNYAQLSLSEAENVFLQNEIRNMLKKGIIEHSKHENGEYISSIFLREKKTAGQYRMILNLKKLNKFVEKHHFKMDTLAQTIALVTPGAWMLSLDFQDAYYSLAVHKEFRKYLKFKFQDKLYEFTCLPNGLTSAPRFFTKVLKVMLSHMRKMKGMTISGYLDDQCIIADSYDEALRAGNYAINLFQDGGFKINVDKSVLKPTQSLEHLGFILDSKKMKIHMSLDKIEKIKKIVNDSTGDKLITIRQVAALAGRCIATRPANPWAMLYTKNLEIDRNRALAENKYNYDSLMSLSAASKKDLDWWLSNLQKLKAPVSPPKIDLTLKTDASTLGWGCFLENTDTTTGGRWSTEEQMFHINYLELKAILLSLGSVCGSMSNMHIRIMSDNMTAVCNINKQGSTQSMNCNSMARQIWEFANQRNLWISAVHLPGSVNIEADRASRQFQDETEWTLRDDIFQYFCRRFGEPDIDLFATRLNNKVTSYAAWKPDPGAQIINSLMHPWSQYTNIYAFPPFSIIHLVLQKFIADDAEGIIVVPFWTTKPWFTQFADLIYKRPILINVTDDVLFLPFDRPSSRRMHPLAGKLQLIAARCTTNSIKLEEYRRELSKRSRNLEENHLTNCTPHTLSYGRNIVSKGVLIPLHLP